MLLKSSAIVVCKEGKQISLLNIMQVDYCLIWSEIMKMQYENVLDTLFRYIETI